MNQQAQQFIRTVLGDPGWLFYHFDPNKDRAFFIRVSEDDYRRAAFLDQRLSLRNPKQIALPLSALQSVYDQWSPPPRPGHFIFHVGHCGSTLLSRLLGEVKEVFAIREPLPLGLLSMARRDQGGAKPRLTTGDYPPLQHLVLHLLKRVFKQNQTPIIKATSICGNLVLPALQNHPDSRTVLMYVNLEVFLAGMLRNKVRREEIDGSAETNVQDMNRHLGTDACRLSGLDQAQRTVVTWLAKMVFFSEMLNGEYAGRCLLLDFEQFLHQPQSGLSQVAGHLGLEADPEGMEEILDGPLMHTYAKGENTPFNAQDRGQQLARARREHAGEIRAGLAWADALLHRYAVLAPLGRYI